MRYVPHEPEPRNRVRYSTTCKRCGAPVHRDSELDPWRHVEARPEPVLEADAAYCEANLLRATFGDDWPS